MPEQTVIYGISEKTDGKTYPLEIDSYTGALQTLDVSHHHIHEGDAFMYFDSISLGSAATQDYLITTPDSTYYTNWLYTISGTLGFTLTLFEATDKTGTTAQTVLNKNRNSATAARTLVHKAVQAGTTDGTQLYTLTVGTATGPGIAGGEDRNDEEIVLKRNTKYIVRILSNAAANRINLKLSWYEHPNFYA